jgi:hypothetical protein
VVCGLTELTVVSTIGIWDAVPCGDTHDAAFDLQDQKPLGCSFCAFLVPNSEFAVGLT